MPILVDYTCRSCGTRAEHWTPSPPANRLGCPACGGESQRCWAPVGLSGGGADPSAAGPGQPTNPPRPSLCSSYPTVPGLCHMSESAGRMWVAKYLGDSRAVDREQQRQEKAAAVRPPTMADAITTHHS